MRGNRPLVISVVAVVLASAVFAYLYLSAMRKRQIDLQTAQEESLEVVPALEEPETEQKPIELLIYQSTPRRPGRPFERKVAIDLATSEEPARKAQQIVNATVEELVAVIPAGSVEQVYLLENGTALIDFSREIAGQIPGGAAVEYAILLSLARSLMNNLENIKQVRFLVGGLEKPTLAGHISLATPFR